MKRWLPVLIGCLMLSAVLSACTLPRERKDLSLDKTAARDAEVTAVFDRYREVRNTAIELLDPKPLSTVETGAVLAIDSGSFEVSQRLAQTQQGESGEAVVTQVETPRFAKYPLWFYAVVNEPGRGVNRVQIFERESSVDPWLLSATPETLEDTALPELRRADGSALAVDPADGRGMAISPQDAADGYAKILGDLDAPESADIPEDSFIKQMRSAAETNAALGDVTFTQDWSADEVRYALRTGDGGVLAFVTLVREDTYEVADGLTVTWPEGTPQRAFLSSGISGSGQLTYCHQVLLYIPGGAGAPRAVGQYGGVVSGEVEDSR